MQAPTQSASVETSSAIPSRAKVSLWRLSGRCWPNLASRIMASNSGPARPRAMGWNGAGGCLMVSQARQVKRSRTVWITFQRRGTTSNVSVTSSPIAEGDPSPKGRQRQRRCRGASVPPQHGQVEGAGSTTRSRGKCAGNGPRTGLRRAGR